jgi:hypothetical protein
MLSRSLFAVLVVAAFSTSSLLPREPLDGLTLPRDAEVEKRDGVVYYREVAPQVLQGDGSCSLLLVRICADK